MEKYTNVTVFDHPLITHKLSILRDINTGSKQFRELVGEIGMLMGYEVMRDLPMEDVEIDTPITRATVKMIAGKKLALVPILRAGLGMLDGVLSLVPSAKIGHIGLYRDHETLEPRNTTASSPRISRTDRSFCLTRSWRPAVPLVRQSISSRRVAATTSSLSRFLQHPKVWNVLQRHIPTFRSTPAVSTKNSTKRVTLFRVSVTQVTDCSARCKFL